MGEREIKNEWGEGMPFDNGDNVVVSVIAYHNYTVMSLMQSITL